MTEAGATVPTLLAGRESVLVAHLDLTDRLRGRVLPMAQLERALIDGVTYNRANLNLTLDDHLPADPVLPSTSGDIATVGVAESLRGHPTDRSLAVLFTRFRELDGRPWPGCPRSTLERQVGRLEALGLRALVGLEQEGYLLATDDDGPIGWREFSGARSLAAMGPFRDALFAACDRAGVPLGQFSKEMGPHQFEFNLPPRDPVTAAEDLVLAQTAAREVARELGYRVTFMPRPWQDEPTSGLHVHLSLHHRDADGGADGNAMLEPGDDGDGFSATARSGVAGILEHASGLAFMAMPTVNSYKRLETGAWTPLLGSWSEENRDALVRLVGRGPDRRIEYRGADGMASPYLLLAGLLGSLAGGIEATAELGDGLRITADVGDDTIARWRDERRPVLPATLDDAIDAFELDAALHGIYPSPIDAVLLQIKRAEWRRFHAMVSPAERAMYLAPF